MRAACTSLPLGLVLALLVAVRPAWADGPHIAFHGTNGAYTVTLFTAPDPLVAGPVELNLLVQRATDGTLVTVAKTDGELTLAGHMPVRFRLAPGGAANGDLPGARVLLPDAGVYELEIDIRAVSSVPVHFAGAVPVEPNRGKRNAVVWAVILPGLLIFLFLINQYAKGQLRKSRIELRRA